ncbi:MAG: hypothetical protein JRF35_12225 [Deltaproteobacteria bacterium]|nr:hypothetical protein [Deltaproteobacteria bacterium]
MEPYKVLEHLEALARKLSVEVVYQKLGTDGYPAGGGLCKVKGAYKVFLDRSEPIERRIHILAGALSSFNRDEVYVLPYVREILESVQRATE